MTEPNSGTENAAAGAENTGAAAGNEQVNNAGDQGGGEAVEVGGISNALAGLVSEETLAELEKLKGGKEEQPAAGSETPGATGEEEEENPAGTEGEKPAGAEADAEKNKNNEKKPEKKNVLGIGKKQEKTGTPIVIENTDQLLGVIKSKFGQEFKEVKELPKFLESVEKWRTDSQKVEEISATNEKYESILSGLPPDIINSIELYYNAQDYMQAFSNKPAFNFELPVDKQDTKALVNHYFKDKFTEEDFAEEKPSQALEIAITAAQDKFNAEKLAKDSQRATLAANAKKQLELYNASVVSSVKNLTQAFPNTDPTELKNIQKTLEGGSQAIVSLFFNSDGSLKDNAAEAVLLAVHGRDVINDISEQASHATETRMNEEILSRGNESRQPKKGTGAGEQQISEGAKKILSDLNKFKTQTTF